MAIHRPLTLPEEILLLALRDEAGTIAMESQYAYAVGGAALAELLLRQRIHLESAGKKRLVGVVNAKRTGEPFLDDCLKRMTEAKKQTSPETWVSRFANTKKLRDRLAAGLCDRGILKADEKKVLLLFTRRIYPEVDPVPEEEVVKRLRDAIFGSSDKLDTRTVVLVALADSAGLLNNVFDKKDLKERKQRIDHISAGNAVGEATQEAIAAVQAAIFVAVILPAVTTSTITN